jgi:lysophospholipase L1-like esterase
MARARWVAALLALGLVLSACPSPEEAAELEDLAPDELVEPEPEEVDWPDSIVALGDSITAATNLDLGRVAVTNPAWSWATGVEMSSLYQRIEEQNPEMTGQAHNLAMPGAFVRDLPAQADEAVATGAELVTILIGANDACAVSVDAMTSREDFAAHLLDALERIESGLPDATVHLLSVPDVTRLWEVLGDDQRARMVWDRFGICQAALSESRTDEERDQVRARVEEFNETIAEVCAEFAGCLDDGGAIFGDRYEAEHVSDADFFHPSVEGQERLAEIVWEAFWGDAAFADGS